MWAKDQGFKPSGRNSEILSQKSEQTFLPQTQHNKTKTSNISQRKFFAKSNKTVWFSSSVQDHMLYEGLKGQSGRQCFRQSVVKI